MSRGPLVSGIVAVVAVLGVIMAFASNGSPYVTWNQAKTISSDDHLHLAGDLIKDSVSSDFSHHILRFSLRDSDGSVVNVVYKGEAPANMSEATKVVAIGHAEGNRFLSDKLLLKCPSKYEAEPQPNATAYQKT